jgi:prepilin-type N-terminal cleavage/methylation domain-containing protein
MILPLQRGNGFTLVELSIVLVIIGLLITAVLKGQTLIEQSHIQGAIKTEEDLAEAAREFKSRYKLWPGDMPSPPIANVIAACNTGGANAGDGKGAINALESQCVPEVLSKAGMVKTDGVENGFPVIKTTYGNINLISPKNSNVAATRGSNPFVPSVLMVVEFSQIPCNVAQEIDRKVDNSDLSNGRVIGSSDSCTVGGANDPVAFIAVAI